MIAKWIKDWKARRDAIKFRNGYNWAVCAFFVEELEIEDIEAYILSHSSPFELGAREAIHKLIRMEVKDDITV